MPHSDPKTPATGSDYDDAHPEQDPAEGSRDVIDDDLAQSSDKSDGDKPSDTAAGSGGN